MITMIHRSGRMIKPLFMFAPMNNRLFDFRRAVHASLSRTTNDDATGAQLSRHSCVFLRMIDDKDARTLRRCFLERPNPFARYGIFVIGDAGNIFSGMGQAFSQPIRDGIPHNCQYYWKRTGGYSSRSAHVVKPFNLSTSADL